MTTYRITGVASAQLPLRVLGLFAQRDVVLDDISIRRDGDNYRIVVAESALSAAHAAIVSEKIKALILVSSVICQSSG